MKEKIKVLITIEKKLKQKTTNKTLGDFIEIEVPDMYEFIFVYGEENIIKQVDKLRPEIIFINKSKRMDTLKLLKTIKQLHPSATIFIFLPNIDDEEQETIDEYMTAGAYKCFSSIMVLDSLIHDMHVALNLE